MNDQDSFSPMLSRPSEHAKQLVEVFLPFCEVKSYSKGVRLPLLKDNIKLCYLLVEGTYKVYRSSDDLLITTIPAPTVTGLGVHDAYIITAARCKVATLSLQDVMRLIAENNLWELVTLHMMQLSTKLYIYSKQLTAPTVYEVICNLLLELMQEPEETRKSIAVERYIREKSHVSRSSVMKILSDLRAGGYIVTEEGRLIEVRHLPPKY